ncbi:MAG: hypothetical protein IKX00_04940 [Bacilli bacterium]|nr:hypothetical protein [Bacilli bacterium]
MKEATGELNATLVVVITVGILSTFFFTVIWPLLKNNLHSNTRCSDAVCKKCDNGVSCKEVECSYKDKSGKEHIITCPYKG